MAQQRFKHTTAIFFGVFIILIFRYFTPVWTACLCFWCWNVDMFPLLFLHSSPLTKVNFCHVCGPSRASRGELWHCRCIGSQARGATRWQSQADSSRQSQTTQLLQWFPPIDVRMPLEVRWARQPLFHVRSKGQKLGSNLEFWNVAVVQCELSLVSCEMWGKWKENSFQGKDYFNFPILKILFFCF